MDDRKLIERLRKGADYHESEGDIGLPLIFRQAADRIESLSSDREAIRAEAFEEAAKVADALSASRRFVLESDDFDPDHDWDDGIHAYEQAAKAIRTLKGEE